MYGLHKKIKLKKLLSEAIKKNVILLVILVVCYSCSWFDKARKEIIKKEKFINVLVDIHLADAVLSQEGLELLNDTLKVDLYYDDILKKHNISANQLKQTIAYYTNKPSEYNKVYEQVLEIISQQEERIRNQKTKKIDTKILDNQ